MVRRMALFVLVMALCAAPLLSIRADRFVFSRNGITWGATWKEVQATEAQEKGVSVYVKPEYPGFRNLEVYAPRVAGFEATSLNYLFYNENFLAVFYEFSWRFNLIDMHERDSLVTRESYFDRIIAAMNSKYGAALTGGDDWVSRNLEKFPDSLLEYFGIKVARHSTWQVAGDTIASLVIYNEREGPGGRASYDAALVYLNPGKLDRLGFGILPGINTEGL